MNTELITKLRSLAAELDRAQIPSKQHQHGSAIAMHQAADALQASQAEIERLATCLTKANSQAEEFERKWYLLCDERDAALARLAEIEKQELWVKHPSPVHHTDAFTIEHVRDVVEHVRALHAILDAWVSEAQSGVFIACPVSVSAAGASPEPSALQAENAKLITSLAACRDAFPVPDGGSMVDDWYVSAMADPLQVPEYVKACVENMNFHRDFYQRRVDLLQQWQSNMRDPERTICCDIIANGQTLPPENAGNRYAVQPSQARGLATVDNMILVPRDLIGAACSAIDKKREAPVILEKLRSYTMDAQPSQARELSDDEQAALLRFNETCEDGQEYDVPTRKMHRLAEIGVVSRKYGGVYFVTEYGQRVIAAINANGETS